MKKIKSPAKLSEVQIGSFMKTFNKMYGSYGELAWRSFVSGVFTALGATAGLALVLVLLGYILEWLGVLPVVGGFFGKINDLLTTVIPKR